MYDRVGQQIGSYRLLRWSGQGGFADVYLGEHVYIKTYGAIKILYTRLANEDFDTLTGHTSYTHSKQSGHIFVLAWAPDSKRVASGSSNGSVQMWEAV